MKKTFPFSCPVCARITEYPLSDLVEGARLNCAFCKCSIRLHGHMLAYVQKEIEQATGPNPAAGAEAD
jgi:hypothetical protein